MKLSNMNIVIILVSILIFSIIIGPDFNSNVKEGFDTDILSGETDQFAGMTEKERKRLSRDIKKARKNDCTTSSGKCIDGDNSLKYGSCSMGDDCGSCTGLRKNQTVCPDGDCCEWVPETPDKPDKPDRPDKHHKHHKHKKDKDLTDMTDMGMKALCQSWYDEYPEGCNPESDAYFGTQCPLTCKDNSTQGGKGGKGSGGKGGKGSGGKGRRGGNNGWWGDYDYDYNYDGWDKDCNDDDDDDDDDDDRRGGKGKGRRRGSGRKGRDKYNSDDDDDDGDDNCSNNDDDDDDDDNRRGNRRDRRRRRNGKGGDYPHGGSEEHDDQDAKNDYHRRRHLRHHEPNYMLSRDQPRYRRYYNKDGIPFDQIPRGEHDKYILKSQIVPPVCPVCPTVTNCGRDKPCPPCPACDRCPDPMFSCGKVPNYGRDSLNLPPPAPMLNSFAAFR